MGKILWLASYPKSGNTWLRVFLANYAQSGGKPFDINRLPDVSFSDSRAAYFEQIAGCPPNELTFEAVHRLRPDVQRLLVQARTDQVWVKTHSAVAVLDDVPTIVPELTSAAIYVVRNPLDVVVSFAHHYGLPMDRAIRAIGFRQLKTSPQDGMVAQFLSDWSSHAKSWLTATRYCVHVVRYEDMIARPLRTFAEIVRGAGLRLDRERLRRAIRRSDFKMLAEQEHQTGFVEASRKTKERFFRRGTVGAWRQELTGEQAQLVVTQHREMMARFGYVGSQGELTV